MLTSSRDNWERLVAAVLKKELYLKLAHQQSRSPSICTTISTSDHSSQPILSDSVSATRIPSVSHVKKGASSRPITRNLFSAWYGRRKSKNGHLVDIPEDATINFPHLRKFSLRELQTATEDFSTRSLIAPDVYRGQLADGSPVVIKTKQIKPNSSCKDSILREIEISKIAAHPNVLCVLGYCITPYEHVVVYPLMVNGSVKSWLRERHDSLDWPTKERIAYGTAKAIAYLHEEISDGKVIHRDIKAANILLKEDFEAVVADFGLAIIVEHSTTNVKDAVWGTVGHIAPEYLDKGRFSEKIDVFGYGVFLLELLTGQKAWDLERRANGDDVLLHDWVKRIVKKGYWEIILDADRHVFSGYPKEVVKLLLAIAVICVRTNPKGRPKMSEVVRMFEDRNALLVKNDPKRRPKMSKGETMFEDEKCLNEDWEEWIKDATEKVESKFKDFKFSDTKDVSTDNLGIQFI